MKRMLGLILGIFFCGVVISLGITQEIPVGKVTGKIVMQENGRPLIDAAVALVRIVSEDEYQRVRGVETNSDGTFALGNVPAGPYYIEISAKQHSLKKQAIAIEEGKTTEVSLEATPNKPYLNLYASQKVFTPDETPQIELHGFVLNEREVKIDLYRVDLAEVAKKGGLREALAPLTSVREYDVNLLEKASVKVADLSRKIEKTDAEGAFIESFKLGKQDEGIYFVICRSGGIKAVTTIIVSNLALITKTYQGKSLCYATNLKSGIPVEGVEILTAQNGVLVPTGKTDQQGLADIDLPASLNNGALVVGRQGSSIAVVGFGEYRSANENIKIAGYCERPAYRPGDEVHFKGVVRRSTKDGYVLPGSGTAEITIKDPDGDVLSTKTLPVSVHGTFNGSFITSKEGKPGGYSISCKAFGTTNSIYANVVSYRKPEFSVEVKSDKSFYTMGQEASATVECQYYYGGPVVGAKVKAQIYRSPKWQYENEDGEHESYSGGSGEYSAEVEAITDASGRAKITFPTRSEDDPEVLTNDYQYTINASVSEDEGKYFDGQGKIDVVRGDHDLTVEVQNPLVAPGESIDLLVKTTDAVDRQKPSPGHSVVVEIGRDSWTESASVFIPRDKQTVTTGADGTVHLIIPVTKAESLSIRATSIDSSGNKVVASDWAYVEGSPAMRERNKGSLDITLDKRMYKSGDDARVLLQTDMIGGSALVCVQSEGILWKKLVPITSESTLVKVPIVKEYAPNVYVSVSYVKEKKFLEAEKKLRVDRADRDLKIEIKSNREVYKPGETAQVTVKTFGSDGKPRAAEVSLGVVDEGIYDVAPDDTNLKGDFYPNRSNLVTTAYSFPEIYLDGGDKGSSKIPLRNKFKDTAQWSPTVWTGDNGEVTVPVVLPDNLTEWRVTAVGVSDSTEIGMHTETFRAKKDLMVRLQLPQYLVDGDRQRMTVIVANDTGKDQDVNLEIEAKGITLTGGAKQVVRVPNGQPQTVECTIDAGDPLTASVSAKAWIDGGPNDGVQQSLEVTPHGRREFEAKSGEGAITFALPIKPTADPKFGSLKISLNPTLAGDLVSSLDELIGFPYGCVEQTMSRFMPSVLVDKTVRDLGLPRPEKLNDLPKIVQDSLSRLENMKHSDGGFGWWEYDESSPFMTALVLDGIDRAKTAGQDVSRLDLDSTFEWSLKRLKAPVKEDSLRDRFYLAYSLIRFGKTDAIATLPAADITKLTPATLANAALAYHVAGQSEKAISCLDQLNKAAQGNDMAYWSEEEYAWGEEVSAIALVSFVTIRPTDPIIPRIVRHLRSSKKGDMWSSTRDTAYSLIGLTGYLATTKELAGDSVATVLVNGKELRTVSMSPSTISSPDWTVEIPRNILGTGDVKIEIRKQGAGSCYYSAELRTLDVAPDLAPETTDRGLKVERQYYRLEARSLENGTLKLLPSISPVSTFKSGDLIRVVLTITTNVSRKYVMIEEPTPSSCRVQERDELGGSEEWNNWWSRTVMRDDHLAFFATSIPSGISKITYTMRAEQAGLVRSLPTTVANMYDPSRHASTGDFVVEVTK